MIDVKIDVLPSLQLVDIRTEKLYYDMRVPLDAALCLSDDSDNRNTIIKSLSFAANLIDMRVPKSDEYYNSIDATEDYLEKEFYGKFCGDKEIKVSCIGHTHIDVAWLWTLEQTKEKVQRSFATVLELMRKYPEYKFMSSQPQLYSYVKQYAPELYEKIKEAVKNVRWEIEGAMWLEADCNITSGESLIRQILFGKRFIYDEFGKESKILWLPDTFGFCATLPQIMKKCGIDNFVTTKMSWNETNKFPYDTFMWEGLDGSQVFTNYIFCQDSNENKLPCNLTTYVGYVRPSQILGTWRRYQQKQYANVVIETFGFEDGGRRTDKRYA